MTEQILTTTERLERLELEELRAGDIVKVTTGAGEQAFHYEFTVEEPRTEPIGQFKETSPDGLEVGPMLARLVGAGRWTTPRQNPCQTGDPLMGRPHQDKAVTTAFGSLYEGGRLIIQEPDSPGREGLHIFDKPGQEITEIIIERA